MKLWIFCFSLLLPTLGLACEYRQLRKCEQQIVQLLSYRSEAIQGAFGDLSVALPAQLQVKFVGSKDPEYPLQRSMRYDAQRRVLLLPRSIARSKLPNPLRAAAYYWPFYRSDTSREAFPIVEAIDDALWTVFLDEAARSRGHVWPHRNCNSADLRERLPCRMLLSAAARFVKVPGDMLFNENRLDRIWPDDFASFEQRNYRYDDPDYADVQRFGGILLMRPLIGEFGVPRVLAYVAQTPLVIEENSLRISALRYQEQARNALRMRSVPAEDHGGRSISIAAARAGS